MSGTADVGGDPLSTPKLQSFGPEIWAADGSEADVAGFRYPTRMVVIRLTGGSLFVWSPVALSARLREEVEALGEVHYLVAPNSLHHLFLSEWRQTYPQARLYGPGLAPAAGRSRFR